MKLKFSWTKAAVILFVAVLTLALYSEDSEARDGVVLSLGHTVLNAHQTAGEVGYRFGRWEAAATRFGHGSTKRGDIDSAHAVSVSRIVRPGWKFLGAENYYRIGGSYVDGMPLVGNWNYRLGLGLAWDLVEVEYFHYSSAGINDPNTGIDGVQFRLRL
ncbi:acyloxyacyl hydrolase [Microbulbifer thermotolerans]|uniref:Acyloxyacyl hydrolase n=1 Tax=Microbulbifer thermotolerans TaxID=252514 RepID=A0AB35HZH5_MICTH|nr:acyloxyacyl hydrolase [Microbulbifer thermotolerans]MCX2780430.1 acyloxyacyl hydrolase [Microbulbifer thermotolerans]MCX2802264.1 acyloxyacyl hydrolase [Microbulbifer thermotolerans]MCX2805898.1 acyloxyacyl hydrolase [Microbulbifer thermotolerans]